LLCHGIGMSWVPRIYAAIRRDFLPPFTTPDSSFTWYIVEGGKQEDGDWLFFSKVVSHLCPDGELGYVLLSQLKQVKGSLGLPVERDIWWQAKPLSQCK